MSCPDWKKIKAEYIAGGTSYRKLAEKYGVSFTTVTRTAKREGWVALRQQAEDKTAAKIVNDVSVNAVKIDDRFYRLVDKLMKRAEETIEGIDTWSVTGLKEMATALKYIKECKGVKSEADIREQEARIAKLQKDAEREEVDNDIQIIIAPDAEDYAV